MRLPHESMSSQDRLETGIVAGGYRCADRWSPWAIIRSDQELQDVANRSSRRHGTMLGARWQPLTPDSGITGRWG